MRSIAASFFAALLLAACGGPSSDLCGELVVDLETDSCQCPEGTERGDDVWTCVLPDGGTIRDPNAPDASRDSGLEDAGTVEVDSGTDASVDAGTDAGVDAGEPDGGCPDRMWYRDRDRDGFGVDDDSVTGCAAPDGYVAEGGDCDDACTACTPFASEICDERDNDCDGTVDEGLPQVTCYRDQDGDGFGDEATTMMACGCPAGWTQRSDLFDCYDRNASVFPGQTEYFSTSYCAGTLCVSSPPESRTTSFDYDCDRRERAQHRPAWAFGCGELGGGECGGAVFWTAQQEAATCGTTVRPSTCARVAGVCTESEAAPTTQGCR